MKLAGAIERRLRELRDRHPRIKPGASVLDVTDAIEEMTEEFVMSRRERFRERMEKEKKRDRVR